MSYNDNNQYKDYNRSKYVVSGADYFSIDY